MGMNRAHIDSHSKRISAFAQCLDLAYCMVGLLYHRLAISLTNQDKALNPEASCAMQVCKAADVEQQWVYVETGSERATHLYLRHGFQIVSEVRPHPDAPVTFCMGRPPKPDVPSDV